MDDLEIASADPLSRVAPFIILAGIGSILYLLSRHLNRPDDWKYGVERLEWRPWFPWHAGALVITILLANVLLGLVLKAAGDIRGQAIPSDSPILMVLGGLSVHGVGLVTILVIMARERISWAGGFGNRDMAFGHKLANGMLFYLAIMPFLFLTGLMLFYVFEQFNMEIEQQEVFDALAKDMHPMMLGYMILLAVVAAPIFEEITFRGLLLPLLTKFVGLAPAILISSLFFAAIHDNLYSMGPLFVLAVGLAIAYVHTQSILVPIIMHGLFNGLNLMWFFLGQPAELPAGWFSWLP
ncbi:MAG: membrane protease YdiL (CAAX protease family) [Kiritimatiellia bacterium]|jgi:membrane protease YdiL (CAAX protease family)